MPNGTQPDQRNVARSPERGPVNGVLVSLSLLRLLHSLEAIQGEVEGSYVDASEADCGAPG
jgi:hypothetical protein